MAITPLMWAAISKSSSTTPRRSCLPRLAETPIYVMATAGMRLLPENQREAVLSETCRYIREHTSFSIDGGGCSEHVQVISGEEEGLLGWISVNYLMDGFHIRGKQASLDGETDVVEGKSTFGFLDMGGASTQIAFEPSKKALQGEGAAAEADLTAVSLRMLDGTEVSHKVFVTTFLGYGTNQARQRYLDLLRHDSSASQSSPKALPDPCLNSGLQLSDATGAHDLALSGTGNFTACLESSSIRFSTRRPRAQSRPACSMEFTCPRSTSASTTSSASPNTGSARRTSLALAASTTLSTSRRLPSTFVEALG